MDSVLLQRSFAKVDLQSLGHSAPINNLGRVRHSGSCVGSLELLLPHDLGLNPR